MQTPGRQVNKEVSGGDGGDDGGDDDDDDGGGGGGDGGENGGDDGDGGDVMIVSPTRPLPTKGTNIWAGLGSTTKNADGTIRNLEDQLYDCGTGGEGSRGDGDDDGDDGAGTTKYPPGTKITKSGLKRQQPDLSTGQARGSGRE